MLLKGFSVTLTSEILCYAIYLMKTGWLVLILTLLNVVLRQTSYCTTKSCTILLRGPSIVTSTWLFSLAILDDCRSDFLHFRPFCRTVAYQTDFFIVVFHFWIICHQPLPVPPLRHNLQTAVTAEAQWTNISWKWLFEGGEGWSIWPTISNRTCRKGRLPTILPVARLDASIFYMV